MSGLLINERFVAVFPSLVRRLGSIESAVILQHLHFNADDEGDIRMTVQQVSDDTGIAVRTVERRLRLLREEGYVTAERSASYDATLTYRIDTAKLADSTSADAELVEGGSQSGGIQSANLAVSSVPTEEREEVVVPVGSQTARGTGAIPPRITPEQHDRIGMTVDWTPRPVFWRYLLHQYEITEFALGVALTRFRAYAMDNSRFSRSWENSFEAWVAEDHRRAMADIDAGATDHMGVPLNQRRVSAIQDLQPGDEGYVDPEELQRLAESLGESSQGTDLPGS